jgi:hypothetical protein
METATSIAISLFSFIASCFAFSYKRLAISEEEQTLPMGVPLLFFSLIVIHVGRQSVRAANPLEHASLLAD